MSLVKFIGVGHYCPENIVTNNKLSEIVVGAISLSDKKNFIFNFSPQHFNLLFQLEISFLIILSCILLLLIIFTLSTSYSSIL